VQPLAERQRNALGDARHSQLAVFKNNRLFSLPVREAFALAYAARYAPLKPDVLGQSKMDIVNYVLDVSQTYLLQDLVKDFIANIQRKTDPPQAELATYLSFQTTPETTPASPIMETLWERASWIEGERLEHDLTGCQVYSRYPDSPDLSRKARIEGILRRQGYFVAMVDEDRVVLQIAWAKQADPSLFLFDPAVHAGASDVTPGRTC
jgi:hypothetical protein